MMSDGKLDCYVPMLSPHDKTFVDSFGNRLRTRNQFTSVTPVLIYADALMPMSASDQEAPFFRLSFGANRQRLCVLFPRQSTSPAISSPILRRWAAYCQVHGIVLPPPVPRSISFGAIRFPMHGIYFTCWPIDCSLLAWKVQNFRKLFCLSIRQTFDVRVLLKFYPSLNNNWRKKTIEKIYLFHWSDINAERVYASNVIWGWCKRQITIISQTAFESHELLSSHQLKIKIFVGYYWWRNIKCLINLETWMIHSKKSYIDERITVSMYYISEVGYFFCFS